MMTFTVAGTVKTSIVTTINDTSHTATAMAVHQHIPYRSHKCLSKLYGILEYSHSLTGLKMVLNLSCGVREIRLDMDIMQMYVVPTLINNFEVQREVKEIY